MSNYAVMPITDYANTCDAIREKTNISDVIKSGELSEKVSDVYNAGKRAEYDEFWDYVQSNGKRTNYLMAFGGSVWDNTTFKPKYDLKPTNAGRMFWYTSITDLTGILKNQDVVLDTSNATDVSYLLASPNLIYAPVIDIRKAKTSNTGLCSNSNKLVTFEKIIVSADNGALDFTSCSKLANITFEGEIGKTLNMQWSPVTVESMKSAILHLKNYAGTDYELSYTIKFPSTRWIMLEADSTSPTGTTWKEYVASLGWNAK